MTFLQEARSTAPLHTDLRKTHVEATSASAKEQKAAANAQATVRGSGTVPLGVKLPWCVPDAPPQLPSHRPGCVRLQRWYNRSTCAEGHLGQAVWPQVTGGPVRCALQKKPCDCGSPHHQNSSSRPFQSADLIFSQQFCFPF